MGSELRTGVCESFCASFDADNDASRIVECLESQHRLQSLLHPAVVLFHNFVQVLTAKNPAGFRPRKLDSPFIPMRRSALWLGR